jgi:hypothetical protein
MISRLAAGGFLLAVFGCAGGGGSGRKTTLNEGAYPSGKPQYRVEIDGEGRKHGKEIWWYENGGEMYSAENEHGIRHGPYQAWYQDGKPWYQGKEIHGRPQDTLIYWHPNGALKTFAVYRDGRQLNRRDFDSTGAAVGSAVETLDEFARRKSADSARARRLREEGIREWSRRVRTAVESYWVLPREMVKHSHRAVVNLRVRRNGEIAEISWIQKSPSNSFNILAQKALKNIRRLPAFPPSVPDKELAIQYEFVTPGAEGAKKKLELKGGKGP